MATTARKIFVLDDEPARHVSFRHAFAMHDLTLVDNFNDAIKALSATRFNEVWLDRDLNDCGKKSVFVGTYGDCELTGEDVVSWMIREMPIELRPDRVVVHSLNVSGGPRMRDNLTDAGFRATWELFQTHPALRKCPNCPGNARFWLESRKEFVCLQCDIEAKCPTCNQFTRGWTKEDGWFCHNCDK